MMSDQQFEAALREAGQAASKIRRALEDQAQRIGRVEAREGPRSKEAHQHRQRFHRMVSQAGSLAQEMRELAETIQDIKREYDL